MAATRRNERYLPGRRAPGPRAPGQGVRARAQPPRPRRLRRPRGRAARGRRRARPERSRQRTGVLVLSKGLVPPLGTLPSAYVAERTHAWATGVLGGPAHAAEALDGGASLVLAATDDAFARQVSDALAAARLRVDHTTDVDRRRARRLRQERRRARRRRRQPPPARTPPGAAAGKVFAEIDAFARGYGSKPETFAGLAGHRRPRRHRARRGLAATAARASCSRRACPPTRSAPRSARPPRPSPPSRCSPRACSRPASTRRCSRAWPGSSRARSTPSAGPQSLTAPKPAGRKAAKAA